MNLELVGTFDYDGSSNLFVVDNVFTSDYDNYFVSMNYLSINGNRNPSLSLLDSSGTTVSTNYTYIWRLLRSFTVKGATSGTLIGAANYIPSYFINDGNQWASGRLYFHQPASSSYTTMSTYGGADMVSSNNMTSTQGFAICERNEVHRGFQINVNAANVFTGGQIIVYGIK